ncbi:ribosome 60S biogenesis N-terminal-domain-containing protein [Coemansia spiralis]|nr:ribosome 60S biogenesis N-terminal-domain-containing protein [Coemansia spiralis]
MGKDTKHHASKRKRLDPVDSAEQPTENNVEKESVEEPSSKYTNYEHDAQISFKSAGEIADALGSSSIDLLIQGLTHLREHLKLCNRADDENVPAQARLLQESCRRIVYEWAQSSGEFNIMSSAWQLAQSQNIARLEALVPSVIANLLVALDTPEALRFGNKLIQMILNGHMKSIYRAFNTPRSAVCASVLQMLYQVVVFSRGEFADDVRHSFDWTMNTLESLSTIRSNVVGFSIRRLWARFVLSFFSAERCNSFAEIIKTRTIFTSLFHGVEKDTYPEVHALISTVYLNVVLNDGISRADKVRVFGTRLMGQLANAAHNTEEVVPQQVGIANPMVFVPKELVSGTQPAIITTDSISALIIRFFKGMMTYPGYGICFHQYGLYPAPRKWQDTVPVVAEAAATSKKGGGAFGEEHDASDIYEVALISKNVASSDMRDLCNNQILRILVTCIDPAVTKRMGDLAIEIFRANPELVAPFWRNYSCSLEPRLSLRYLGNTAFAIKVLGLPLPVPKGNDSRYSDPPRLNTIVEHIAPISLTRLSLGRGLQMRSLPLVRYRNLLLIDMVLRKLGEARAWIQAEARSGSQLGAEINSWTKLDQRLLAVVKQRIPEWKLVMVIHNEMAASTANPKLEAAASEESLCEIEMQRAVLGNVIMKVINGYQTHFSDLVVETSFEFGKLISDINLFDIIPSSDYHAKQSRNPIKAHTLLYLLHALATTSASSVKWMTRVKSPTAGEHQTATAATPHTNLGVIMLVYLFAIQPDLRLAARTICLKALQSTSLFDHDTSTPASEVVASEASCWLDALAALVSPHANRNACLPAVDQRNLTKAHRLVDFLEDAIGHASKLPYKYADRIHSSIPKDSDYSLDGQLPFSPLLSAVVEAAVLKVATGNGALATQLRSLPSSRIATEMLANSTYAYIREVICQIAELRSKEIAQCLERFLSVAAAAILTPRLAKLDNSKDADKAAREKNHYYQVEIAFASAFSNVQRYLSIVGAFEPSIGRGTVTNSIGKLPSKISKKLKQELEQVCRDIDNGLMLFIDKLIAVVQENSESISVSLITEWLLKQANSFEFGERQSTFIIIITWISLNDRIGADDQSLWDMPIFVDLAAEILQIDDTSFLLAMFRHLIASKSFTSLLKEECVQRLLTHLLLANAGSIRFCGVVAHLLQRITTTNGFAKVVSSSQSESAISTAITFTYALTTEHLNSFPKTLGYAYLYPPQTIALRIYANKFNIMLSSSMPEIQHLIDFNTSILARKSAQAWLESQEATRIWQPFVIRIAKTASACMESMESAKATKGSIKHALGLPSLICILSPVMTADIRIDLLKSYGAVASRVIDPPTLCVVANAVFTLMNETSGDSHSVCDISMQQIRSLLTSRIIDLWAKSLNTTDDSTRYSLEHAVNLATRYSDVAGYIRGPLKLTPKLLRQKIEQATTQLHQLDKAYSSNTSIDIAHMLSHLCEISKDKNQCMEDSAKYHIIARILSNDFKLRQDARKWTEAAAFTQNISQSTNKRFFIWLLHVLSMPYAHETEHGFILWEDSSEADKTRSLCLNIGALLLNDLNTDNSRSTKESSSIMFFANVFIQYSSDQAAVDTICHGIAKLETEKSSLVQACTIRSKALRIISFPDQTATFVEAVCKMFQFAQTLVPDVNQVSDDCSSNWKSMAVLASAFEHCWSIISDSSALGMLENDASNIVPETTKAGFYSIDSIIRSICRPFEEAVDMNTVNIEQKAALYPATVYRCMAFALQSVRYLSNICDKQSDSTRYPWFSTLRFLLGCRFFNGRMYNSDLRNHLTLVVSGLWHLASPSLSRWSASLDDYFTLDELEALLGVYSGSCSLSDGVLLQVISGYEQTTGQSVQRAALVFGPKAAGVYINERINRARYLIERDENDVGVISEDTITNALATIDGSKLFRTILNFPTTNEDMATKDPIAQLLTVVRSKWNGLKQAVHQAELTASDSPSSTQVYSSWFALAWVWSVVSSGQNIDIRKLIECNAVGLAFVSLSSADLQMRKLAYYVLDKFYALLAGTKKLGGQKQCILLLNSVRNAITGRNAFTFPQIPFGISLFAATSLYIMIHPEHVMFSDINRLLLKKPYLRLDELPLLRRVLQSSTSTYRQRSYVLRLATQSSRSFDQSLMAFKRSNLVNTVLALASSSLGDIQASKSAMTLLFNLTSAKNPDALIRHVSKNSFSLLSWIREQATLEINTFQQMAGLMSIESEGSISSGGGGSTSALRGMQACAITLTALLRVVIRAIANYPLTRLHEGKSVYNKFWVLQSADQADAPGQSMVLGMVRQILDGLRHSLCRVGICAYKTNAKVAELVLGLLRTCLDARALLSDMQICAGDQNSAALQSPVIAHDALCLLRSVEHMLEKGSITESKDIGGSDGKSQIYHDPFNIVTLSKAESIEALYQTNAIYEHAFAGTNTANNGSYHVNDIMECYKQCVGRLFSICFSAPWPACAVRGDAIEVVSRAFAINAPSVVRILAWIRECNF